MAAGRIGVLDAWRGISIMLVIAGHLAVSRFRWFFADGTFASLRAGHVDLAPVLKATIWRLAESGAIFGLATFFVISGYLITSILAANESGTLSLRAFYVRRICRIVPALAVMVACTFVLWRAGQIESHAAAFVQASTFTCDIVDRCGWTFGHLWSVSLEEQFYLLWPVGFVVTRVHRRGAARAVLATSLGLVAFGPSATHDVAMGLSCIALGSLFVVDERFRQAIHRTTGGFTTTMAALLFCAQAFVPSEWRLGPLAMLTPLAVFLIVAETLRSTSVLRACIDRAPLRAVGLISYSLYLWQQMFTQPFADGSSLILRHGFLLVPVAILSYRFVEQPGIALGRRWTTQARRPGATTSTPPAR